MKLYRCQWNEPHVGQLQAWFGTQRDVSREKTRLKKIGLEVSTEEVDVPTQKAALLIWLNANCKQCDAI
jgi:hypothetical protein